MGARAGSTTLPSGSKVAPSGIVTDPSGLAGGRPLGPWGQNDNPSCLSSSWSDPAGVAILLIYNLDPHQLESERNIARISETNNSPS